METRFGHLLKPIRDLAENWDIDIASQLEDYLSELEQLVVTFDCGATTMNFAEAALLIQGSVCIYSRKVEYFYSLVYQALELLASKRKQAHAPSVDNQGHDRDATFDKSKQEFLPLDDIKASTNLDLCENKRTKEIDPVPRTPMSLVAYRDDEKENCALISPTGEILGNRKDFKLNTGILHVSGAMLLDFNQLENVEQIYRQMMDKMVPAVEMVPLEGGNAVETDGAMLDVGHAVDECVDEYGGLDGFGDYSGNVGSPGMQEGHENVEQHLEEKELRKTRQKPDHLTSLSLHRLPSKADPWQFLDPHDPSGIIEKPFKEGQTCCVPSHLMDVQEKEKGRKRKRPVAKQPPPLTESLWEFCRRTMYSTESSLPKNPLRAPAFAEFQDLFWAEQKKRASRRKRDKKMLSRLLGDWQEFFPHEPFQESEDNKQEAEGANENNGLVDGDWGGGDWEEGGGDAMSPVADEQLEEQVEPLHVTKSLVVQSYEELVKKHLQLQLLVAQQYLQETELSRRVRLWEETVAPILAKEEEHNVFDIHCYGDMILQQLEQLGIQQTGSADSPVPFCKLAREKEPFEVCRILLASLQLANSENIEISTEEETGPAQHMDKATVRLLSKDKAHTRFAAYRVPSFEDS